LNFLEKLWIYPGCFKIACQLLATSLHFIGVRCLVPPYVLAVWFELATMLHDIFLWCPIAWRRPLHSRDSLYCWLEREFHFQRTLVSRASRSQLLPKRRYG